MKIKLTWILVFKIFITLFWIANINLLFYAAITSSKGISYYLFNDYMFQYFLLIGVFGLFSIFLEKFYRNAMCKYFILSFLLISYYFFLHITAQFLGITSSRSKGYYFTFYTLLLHYIVNFILISLSTLEIYGVLKNSKKIIYFGFLCTLLYLSMYIFFYGAVIWDRPIERVNF
ncbi:hypothetical protein GZ693_002125 [Campylobacter coli]|uniref:hypothetical protein n=1 Tax=Campylobacter coli TaxID=195 RepID=UPI000716F2E9|nr:hypothetical protein [Campylobacter coli]EAI0449468.1 hypothetical protein [Campylobacter coli]EAI4223204.1 hypothetical protein [Campylobacter coli]EAI7500552.1 hypothetical protein [Campylobacter coli]EAI7846068.1 hypothetical protein [Campylobacter coli]EAJ8978054.1 hypothetical protein [Campylobacter coli]